MADERGQQEMQDRQHTIDAAFEVSNNQQREPQRNEPENSEPKRTSNRGFAAMSPERQKQIASEGGRAAHRQGVAHEWNRDEAREAGRKGGQIVSRNREHMSEIGRKGGQRSGSKRSQRTEGGDAPL